MRYHVVIDTNVWISGIFWEGSVPSKVLDKIEEGVQNGDIKVYFSDDTFREWEEKVSDKALKFNRFEDYLVYRKNLLKTAVFVYPQERVDICRDPKDNKFLEAAFSAGAEYIISGDHDLLSLKKFKNTSIFTPVKFVKLF